MSEMYDIADVILNERKLLINGKLHDICEIEVYMHHDEHSDPYVHCHPEQSTQGNFYFHRASLKVGAKYKSGTFKGVDLTYGFENIYAGILIRSIKDSEGKLITGPCNVVTYILQCYEVNSIDELTNGEQMSFSSNGRDLLLVKTDKEDNTLYKGPRIGLSDKYPEWRDIKYRFTTVKKGLKSNGQLRPIS